MTKALVTGGAGFVGRHLVKELLERGFEVTIIDAIKQGSGAINPNNSWPLFEPRDFLNFKFIEEDCRHYLPKHQNDYYDYVFHLAAVVGGRISIENNALAVGEDLAIDSDFWNWTIKAKPKKL